MGKFEENTSLRATHRATDGVPPQRLRIGFVGPVNGRDLADLVQGCPPLHDGAQAPILSFLIRELLARGHHVEVFTLSPVGNERGSYSGTNFRLHIGQLRPRARDRALDAFKVERESLLSLVQESTLDILHAHWTYEYALASLDAEVPALVTVHDWAPAVLRYQRHPYRLVRLLMQRRVLREAPHLSANSPYISEKIARHYGRRVAVIPNGLAFGRSQPTTREASTIVVFGALNVDFGRRKNVTTLLQAFQLVRSTAPSVRLRLAGSGYGPNEAAQRWARSNGLDTGVEFLGPLASSDVAGYLRTLDVFVHPSLEESFGMVLIEAMREGVAVIGGAESGAVPWVLDAGGAGTLANVRSAEALASAMRALIEDRQRRTAQAKAGYENATRRFSIAHVVDLYEAEYRSILVTSRRRVT